ncbi:MAG: serine hydrolase [Anaerolineaceae bacterium]|nr:serine hydrolase [Anaerolineaceae bacterium]
MLTSVKNALVRATPESQGIASTAILQFVQAVESQIHEIHSFMLVRHGKVVAEGWWSPYGRDYKHMLFSLSKSFTSTAIGLAVNEGLISLDDKVISFFPDEAPAEPNEHLAAMQIRHLLSMSTGHDVDTQPPMGQSADGKWTKVFFEVPVIHKPGTHFLYNTGATYMLSAILQKVTGTKLIDYLQPRLLEPLGIEGATWQVSPQGINTGGFGLNIKTEDIANFGQLYLQKGKWNGRQLVPEAWIDEATRSHISNGDNPENDWNQGYGYQFWRCRHNAYRGDGAFGQYCIVMPEQDAVLAITSGLGDMQAPLDLVWDILLPAMSSESLPDSPSNQSSLVKKLADLKFNPVQGQAASAVSESVYGRVYKLDANELGFETIALKPSGNDSWTINIKKGTVEDHITCGYLTWHKGETTMFNQPWELEAAPIVVSGAWIHQDMFTLRVRFYETPFYQTITLRFANDNLTVDTKINVGFQPPETVTLIGHTL